MNYRQARTKHDKIKLMTNIQYIQKSWREKKEKNKKINVYQLHNIWGSKQIVQEDVSKYVLIYFYRKGPKFSANLFYLFFPQVNDLYDTAAVFNRSLFAAGINAGDKTDDLLTNFAVSIKRYLTLRTELTYYRDFNKDTIVGHASKYNSVISVYFLLRYNLRNRHYKRHYDNIYLFWLQGYWKWLSGF